MKQLITFSLFILLSQTTIAQISGNWINVGPIDIANGSMLEMAKGTNDTLFIQYSDLSTSGNDELSLRKFNGTSWEFVGSQGWSGLVGGGTLQPYIHAITTEGTNEIYTAFANSVNGGPNTVVRIFNHNGTSWSAIGSFITLPSNSTVVQLNIERLNGTTWLSYVVENTTNGTLSVKTAEFDGFNWVQHNPSALPQNLDIFSRIDMAYAGSNYYLTFRDATGKIRVFFLNGGLTWLSHQGGGYPSNDSCMDPVLKSTGNELYILYRNILTQQLEVMRDVGGSSWTNVGLPFGADTPVYYDFVPVSPTEIWVSYVAFDDNSTAKSLYFDGISWQEVGSALYNNQEYPLSVELLSSGVPVVGLEHTPGENMSVLQFEMCQTTNDLTTSLNQETITATQTGALYQWLDCDNGNAPIASAINQSFTATQNGNYACEITNGCALDTTACVEISTLSLTDINVGFEGFVFHPNPVKDEITINTHGETAFELEIVDVNGQVVYRNDDATVHNLSFLKQGFYIIKVEMNNHAYSSRLIKL